MATGHNPHTRLRIAAQLTTVSVGESSSAATTHTLPIGFLLPGAYLLHQPPTPLELENAIEAIEDIVMPLSRWIPPGTQLATGDSMARRLAELSGAALAQSVRMPIGEVEASFNALVDIAHGRPSAGSPFLDSELCGYLLILREFMHHLAFADVMVDGEPA